MSPLCPFTGCHSIARPQSYVVKPGDPSFQWTSLSLGKLTVSLLVTTSSGLSGRQDACQGCPGPWGKQHSCGQFQLLGSSGLSAVCSRCMGQQRVQCQTDLESCSSRLRISQLCVSGCARLLQSCLTLMDPVDCSPPGSSVHGILQGRILEWVAMPSSRGSS